VSLRFLLVAGARPNFMKVAAILESFAKRSHLGDGAEMKLVHTGQHYDRALSDGFFEDLSLPEPDIHLGAGSGSHAAQTARIMLAFEKVCIAERPDWVVVVGDVNSTLACSITARKLGVRVAHVEAGLRSRDMSMPEEINRLCTDAISDLLFTTDEIASQNLRHEGVCPERIDFVGNTMIDTLLRHVDRARSLPLPDGLEPRRYGVVTLHRPSNVDSPETLGPLFSALKKIAASIPLVFPVHPRTRRNLEEFGFLQSAGNIRLMEPMGYLQFISLISRSAFVLTDSGGIQEETTVLGIPCLTMRNNTERPITCTLGTNILVGTDPERIRHAACSVLDGQRSASIPPKWDGHAGARIVDRLLGIVTPSSNGRALPPRSLTIPGQMTADGRTQPAQ
jgi:UDP-N-acetylglucosamine 2-epimerase (non-hydrolysing)